MKNGSKKQTAKTMKIKTQIFLMQNLDSGHIIEVKAVSAEGAIAQIGERWIVVG